MSKHQCQLNINPVFAQFINQEVLPLSELGQDDFWAGFDRLLAEFIPRNRDLLEKRSYLQTQIDHYHRQSPGQPGDMQAYIKFLRGIDYLTDEGPDFTINVENVDAEIAEIAGPQLVVPLKNARFALNALNARWGSLYDALYGTNAIEQPQAETNTAYSPARGAEVIKQGRDFLDAHFPLASGSHHDVTQYWIYYHKLCAINEYGQCIGLKNADQLIAFNGDRESPSALLFKHHGLHVEIQIDRGHAIGATDKAGIADIQLESALTTIMDAEDSVAAVDTEDKIDVYRNWLGLTTGSLIANFNKGGQATTRRANAERVYSPVACNRDDEMVTVSGRSLMLIRNVGHLMTLDTIHDRDGNPVPEGILDGVVTALIASLDMQGPYAGRNSKTGSIYIVKPKMHGPEEVRFTTELFGAIEELLKLPRNCIKLGLMDEERRTSANLKSCIREAKERLVFINTGFLDRTGDEIHTGMQAGAFLPKAGIKQAPWITAYEERNVSIGLACGLRGHAQIGKGMWAMPDEMRQMLELKAEQLLAGANTAWVPSPTAATLHATHYHQVNVSAVQEALTSRPTPALEELLTHPLMDDATELEPATITRELENNAQSILGYVVRWVGQGIGCSKVPDIDDVGLMEDRATLRISSQLLANWCRHNVCTVEQVTDVFKQMVVVVDRQNEHDPAYIPMGPNPDSHPSYQAALRLVLEGADQPSGYTEPLLHAYRRLTKPHKQQRAA